MKQLLLFICAIVLSSCGDSNKLPKADDTNPALGEYVYVDRINVIHSKRGCSAVYKEKSMQAVIPFSKNEIYLIYIPTAGMSVCSQCISDKQIQQLDSVFSSDFYINRRWMYENVNSRYSDINSWKDFNLVIEDEQRRLNLYNYEKDKYDLGSFEKFSYDMGIED